MNGPLSPVTKNAILLLPAADLKISAKQGWLKISSGSKSYEAAAVAKRDVYVRVVVASASYDRSSNRLTLRGSGFTGAQIDSTMLRFRAARETSVYQLQKAATVTVDGAGTTVSIVLSAEDATYFESTFAGKSVYLNTESGWMTDEKNRAGSVVPTDSVLFRVPSSQ